MWQLCFAMYITHDVVFDLNARPLNNAGELPGVPSYLTGGGTGSRCPRAAQW